MNITDPTWTSRILDLAMSISSWSKDQNTTVGCVILTRDGKPKSFGYNGIPSQLADSEERVTRPLKYYYTECAERNAIYHTNDDLTDCVLFSTHAPCPNCVRAILRKNITTVVIDKANGYHSEWAKQDHHEEGMTVARRMLAEAKVEVIERTLPL